MPTLISTFTDRQAARRAVERLAGQGFAPGSVHLRDGQAEADNSVGVTLDEVVTGGFFHNAANLLDGLFDMHANPTEAKSYADVVAQGGAVVAVDVPSEADAERARLALTEAGASGHAMLPQVEES